MPVLMLTARDTLDDKFDGFEHGANDYLAKPLSFKEVGAWLGALVKGYRRQVAETVLCCADVSLDLKTLTVERAGRTVKMPTKCLQLLRLMMQGAGPGDRSRGARGRGMGRCAAGFVPPLADGTHGDHLRRSRDPRRDRVVRHRLALPRVRPQRIRTAVGRCGSAASRTRARGCRSDCRQRCVHEPVSRRPSRSRRRGRDRLPGFLLFYISYRNVAITLRGAPGMLRLGLEPCAETI